MVFRLIGWIIGIGLAAILLIGFVIVCPLITLYAINTLFAGYISLEYNWVNWLCVAWFHMCVAASAGSKSLPYTNLRLCLCYVRRYRKGLMFACTCCGYQLHSDLVGARNIELRTRNSRYTLELQGCEVSHPDECPEFLQSLKPVTSVMGN